MSLKRSKYEALEDKALENEVFESKSFEIQKKLEPLRPNAL